ncbi:hypothetical protein ASE21_07265 [Flavobacterium sp. Root901]|uniref:hypothetical protein n=1 Tax=Flavobacterium sp. Root901 TaxID=1736605 RepID=UPI00071001B0|nr:hypothetical protein [Flavobacterium sp. Root901]KRD11498.1 hypothetical protein ASE21_07265 [Flavobacterium sp. Root901]
MTENTKKPLTEIYVKNNYLVINNSETFEIEKILSLELIRNLSFLNKIIQVTFGLIVPAKSNKLRIKLKNGFKDIMLADYNIEKVEILIYEVNQLILKKQN